MYFLCENAWLGLSCILIYAEITNRVEFISAEGLEPVVQIPHSF